MRMLAGSNNDYLTVEGIAFEAGFADRRSFYRVFKKYTGLSPSDFSHQHKK
jgi:AraC-like DNA-binding protein